MRRVERRGGARVKQIVESVCKTGMTKTDCFAYDCRTCKALKRRFCDFEECKFYKPRTEATFYDSKKYSI